MQALAQACAFGMARDQIFPVNWMDGMAPPDTVQEPMMRLLVSPVVLPSLMQVGAAVVPSVTSSFVVTDVPVLKYALAPELLPSTLKSADVHTDAMSRTVSFALTLYASAPLAKTTESLPLATALAVNLKLASWLIG
ncbi:hypothetical protein A6R71_15270 [Xanthomonas translucens pv. arrhenatheri]|nr:hypothetical protein A6R71_15270 [Xanthomonas translucens pv. arrhenatheri]